MAETHIADVHSALVQERWLPSHQCKCDPQIDGENNHSL